MATHWEDRLLSDVVRFGNGKAIKPGGTGVYPVFGSNGIIGGSDEFLHENGVVIGRVGAYCGAVVYCPTKFWASDNTLVAYPSSDQVDTQFLYHLLVEANLSRYAGGAAQPLVTQTVLRQVEVRIPELDAQLCIAGILSAYDELIENSQRRIKILESMARALYREWFVHFSYPGHESVPLLPSALGDIPQGWEVKPFSALASYVNGYPFKPAQLGIEGKPIIKIKELKGGIIADTPRNPGDGIPEKYNIYDGDVLFSWSADLDTYLWMGGEGFLNQHLFTVLPAEDFSLAYCFHALKEAMPRFRALSLGATMHHIKRSALDQVFTVVGPAATRKRFESLVEPIHYQLITLTRLVTNLRATRELLLPRLLSGRIDVFRQDEEGAA